MPVAFAGSGYLVTYYSGVSGVLQERGVIAPGVTPLAGASGGAVTAVLSGLGMSGGAQQEFFAGMVSRDCGEPRSCARRLHEVMQRRARELLPANASEAVSGRVRVAVSQLDASARRLSHSASWIIDSWHSKEDLVACLTASIYLPCWTGPEMFTHYRGEPSIDGAFANGFRQFCENPENCLTVSSFHVGPKAAPDCDADLCPSSAADGCGPPPARQEPISSQLYQNPADAGSWRLRDLQHGCSEKPRAHDLAKHAPGFVPQDQIQPAIHPGKYHDLPVKPWDGRRVLACEWKEWATAPPGEHTLEAMHLMYEQGVKDAIAWCEEHSY